MNKAIDYIMESFKNWSLSPGKEPVAYITVGVAVLVAVLTGDVNVEELMVLLGGLFARGRVSPT